MGERGKSKEALLEEIRALNERLGDIESGKIRNKQTEEVLCLFQTLTDVIAESQDVDTSLTVALKEICEVTGIVYSQIWVPSVDGRYLECSQAWHSQSNEHRKFRKSSEILRMAPGEELPGSVFLSKKPRWIADVRTEKNFPRNRVAVTEGLLSAFAVPILVNDRVLAVVEFLNSECRKQEEDKDLIPLLAGYAAQLGLLLQRSETEAALRRQEREYRILFENNPTPMWVYDRQTEAILAVNDAAVTHYGYSRDEFLAMNIHGVVAAGEMDGNQPEGFRQKDRQLVRHMKRDGTVILVETTSQDLTFAGRAARVVLLNDVTERHRAEEMIRYQAYHDSLTGLPNRLLFNDRLEMSLARAHREKEMLAVVFLDLDRFKNINDTLGHPLGDRLLQNVAGRLKMHLREEDTVARFGGDEFMVLLQGVSRVRDVSRVAQKILDVFAEPWNIDEHELYVTTSIGIALYPYDGEDIQTLLRNADTAMYRAKESGRNNYQLYTPTMNVKAFEHLMLENRLRFAIEHDEFVLHYQPQVDLKSGEVIGMEALVRWQHPGLGLLSPTKFIFLAEETGLIVPLGEWVLRASCKQNKMLQNAGLPPLLVSVNLAPRQFQERNLVKMVKRVLKETGLDPKYLGLEVTESVAMENVDLTIQVLREFHKMGIELSIDDFGTGYSSLSYLKKFPIHRLKIDQAFVRDLTSDPNDAAIASSVIMLARNLKIRAMAEGVETPEQLEFLRARECDEAQGYLFSKPLPPEEFEKFVRGYRPETRGTTTLVPEK